MSPKQKKEDFYSIKTSWGGQISVRCFITKQVNCSNTGAYKATPENKTILNDFGKYSVAHSKNELLFKIINVIGPKVSERLKDPNFFPSLDHYGQKYKIKIAQGPVRKSQKHNEILVYQYICHTDTKLRKVYPIKVRMVKIEVQIDS